MRSSFAKENHSNFSRRFPVEDNRTDPKRPADRPPLNRVLIRRKCPPGSSSRRIPRLPSEASSFVDNCSERLRFLCRNKQRFSFREKRRRLRSTGMPRRCYSGHRHGGTVVVAIGSLNFKSQRAARETIDDRTGLSSIYTRPPPI